MNDNDTFTLQEYIQSLRHGNLCQRAAAIALENAHCAGAHHKQWIIDQMLRILAGQAYETLIHYYRLSGDEWDVGIAP